MRPAPTAEPANGERAAHRAIDAVWRIESARTVAALARFTGDVGLAEEVAGDALIAALEQWPLEGVPAKPGAWLLTIAKRRAVDRMRRDERYARKREELERDAPRVSADFERAATDWIEDDVLRLMFVAAHPVLPLEARVALMLRLVGGLRTNEIARAYRVPEATMAQRIVRAKRTLREAGVAFEAPERDERGARMEPVLEAIYLIFNEGYSASAGDAATRPELCHEALRLGRMLAQLVPRERAVLGLVALMELQASRLRARLSAGGEPVVLAQQNRAHWDYLLIGRGREALRRARALGPLERYGLQAAIAETHSDALRFADTDWSKIAAIYDGLFALEPSPIVALNRAMALSMADGPRIGLAALDEIAGAPALADYPFLSAARGDMLERLERFGEAADAFTAAAAMTHNEAERAMLEARASRSRAAVALRTGD